MPRLLILIPSAIRDYIAQFPETRNNAYRYFNYDNRVVDERVCRGDLPSQYKGPNDFRDEDYAGLVAFASTLVDPVTLKYSIGVAAEEALNKAIKSYAGNQFDGKVNANRFLVLVTDLKKRISSGCGCHTPSMAVNAEYTGQNEPTKVTRKTLKQLGITPKEVSRDPRKAPALVKTQEGIVVHKKPQKGASMLKNAQKYTERLDKVAQEIEAVSPEFAYHIDAISDVIEGRREASTLQFDPDEAKYMAGRFNFNVRQREADEPYMDKFNQSNFEQVAQAKAAPAPVKLAYKKVR